jgi:antitoxin component YwqK of YwqJK toxin-antitoxin module
MLTSPSFSVIKLDGNYKISLNSNGRVNSAKLINQKNKNGKQYVYEYRYQSYVYRKIEEFKNNKLHNDQLTYDYYGRLTQKQTYNDGQIIYEEKYNSEGIVTSTTNYQDNKRHGTHYEYYVTYNTQVPIAEYNYANGKLHGKSYIKSSRHGLLVEELNFDNGEKSGEQIFYHEISIDGKSFNVKQRIPYKSGKKHGNCINYSITGEIESEINYYKNNQCGYQYFIEKGKKIEKYMFARKNIIGEISSLIADYKEPVDDNTYSFLKLKYK